KLRLRPLVVPSRLGGEVVRSYVRSSPVDPSFSIVDMNNRLPTAIEASGTNLPAFKGRGTRRSFNAIDPPVRSYNLSSTKPDGAIPDRGIRVRTPRFCCISHH